MLPTIMRKKISQHQNSQSPCLLINCKLMVFGGGETPGVEILIRSERTQSQRFLHQFSVVAITNYQKLSGLKQLRYYLTKSLKKGLTRLKSRCWQGFISSGGSRASLFLLLEAVQIPWFMTLLQQSITLTPDSGITSLSLTLTFLPPSYKDPCAYIEPTQITQDNLSIS